MSKNCSEALGKFAMKFVSKRRPLIKDRVTTLVGSN